MGRHELNSGSCNVARRIASVEATVAPLAGDGFDGAGTGVQLELPASHAALMNAFATFPGGIAQLNTSTCPVTDDGCGSNRSGQHPVGSPIRRKTRSSATKSPSMHPPGEM